MIIQICVGSSCHLKGSQRIVELFQEMIEKYKLSDKMCIRDRYISIIIKTATAIRATRRSALSSPMPAGEASGAEPVKIRPIMPNACVMPVLLKNI